MDKAKTIPEYIEGLMQGLGCDSMRVIETEGPCPACSQEDCTEGCPRLKLSQDKDLGRGRPLKTRRPPSAPCRL